nr:hypothetical protein PRUPE_4G256400 [Ipomoea trifida]
MMDMNGGGGEDETTTGMRSRSFRDEDYNTRRVFLRSYPLQWGDEGEKEAAAAAGGGGGGEKKGEEETTATARESAETSEGMKSCMKKIVVAAFQWRGERSLVLRKFKHKFTLYFVTCIPVGFKAPTHAFISAT